MLKVKVENRFGKLKLVVCLPKTGPCGWMNNGGNKSSSPKDL